MNISLRVSLIFMFIIAVLSSSGTNAQAVVVNEYFNGFSQKTDWVELLIVQPNTDLRNYTLRDFSSGGNPQAPLKFSNNPYWANLPAGLLIVITGDSSVFVQDTSKYKFSILIKKTSDTTYLNGNQFNIAVGSDAIQIRTLSDTMHVHGISHGSGNASSLPPPKAFYPNGLSGGNFIVPQGASLYFTKPSLMSISDFSVDANLAVDTIKGGTPGKPNDNAGNWRYILSLRSVNFNPLVVRVDEYLLKSPSTLGVYAGRVIKEGSYGSGLNFIPGTDKEFYMISDRGPNIDAEGLNGGNPAKIFAIPGFVPRIVKVKAIGDSLIILDSIKLKNPSGNNISGLPLPNGFGGTGEVAYSDSGTTVLSTDEWGIDSEGLLKAPDGTFWICDEYGASVWNVSASGQVINRYRPFPPAANNIQIDTIIKYRKINRGFEGITRTPNGKIYAILQSAMENPNSSAGNNTKVHRLLEIDPVTNQSRTFLYFHDDPTSNIRHRDYKIGDLAAINNNEFLLWEAGLRNNEFKIRMYKLNISGATPVTQEVFNGKRIEQLPNDSITIITGFTPVQKTFYMDLLANGWDYNQDKPEGLSIINDSTFAVSCDNDFGIVSDPSANGSFTMANKKTMIQIYTVSGSLKLSGLVTGSEKPIVSLPEKYSLRQNYPNPFNPVSIINYTVPESQFISIKVYDITGREVKTLVNDYKRPGTYEVTFNGADLASGVYFYELRAGSFFSVKKMVLIK
jgi:hypothetical protein